MPIMRLSPEEIEKELSSLNVPGSLIHSMIQKWNKGRLEHANQDETSLNYKDQLLEEASDLLLYTVMQKLSGSDFPIASELIQLTTSTLLETLHGLGWTEFNVRPPRRPIIYVASPYSAQTREEKANNVERARVAMAELIRKGWAPVAPHVMYAYMDETTEIPEDVFVIVDRSFLDISAALLHLGRSEGADAEAELARRMGIPVYEGIEEVPVIEEVL